VSSSSTSLPEPSRPALPEPWIQAEERPALYRRAAPIVGGVGGGFTVIGWFISAVFSGGWFAGLLSVSGIGLAYAGARLWWRARADDRSRRALSTTATALRDAKCSVDITHPDAHLRVRSADRSVTLTQILGTPLIPWGGDRSVDQLLIEARWGFDNDDVWIVPDPVARASALEKLTEDRTFALGPGSALIAPRVRMTGSALELWFPYQRIDSAKVALELMQLAASTRDAIVQATASRTHDQPVIRTFDSRWQLPSGFRPARTPIVVDVLVILFAIWSAMTCGAPLIAKLLLASAAAAFGVGLSAAPLLRRLNHPGDMGRVQLPTETIAQTSRGPRFDHEITISAPETVFVRTLDPKRRPLADLREDARTVIVVPLRANTQASDPKVAEARLEAWLRAMAPPIPVVRGGASRVIGKTVDFLSGATSPTDVASLLERTGWRLRTDGSLVEVEIPRYTPRSFRTWRTINELARALARKAHGREPDPHVAEPNEDEPRSHDELD